MNASRVIEVDDEGIWIREASRRWGIRWEEIAAVSATKHDDSLPGDPEVVVALDFDYGHFVEIQGSVPGFDAALGAMASRLPGAPGDWQDRLDRLGPDDEPLVLWRR